MVQVPGAEEDAALPAAIRVDAVVSVPARHHVKGALTREPAVNVTHARPAPRRRPARGTSACLCLLLFYILAKSKVTGGGEIAGLVKALCR